MRIFEVYRNIYYNILGNQFSLGFAGCIESLEVNNHYIGHPGGEGTEHKNMKSFHGSFRDILEVCIYKPITNALCTLTLF